MRIFCTLIIVLAGGILLNAQTKKAFTKAGDKAFKSKNFYSALNYYGEALEFDDDNVNLLYKYAEAARMYQALEIAGAYYQSVLESEDANKFPLAKFWMAKVEQQRGAYTEAKSLFQAYLSDGGSANELYAKKAKQAIKDCDWALEQLKSPHQLTIDQLNKRVNTAYSEFGPYLSGDTLYYSSYRFENYSDPHVPARKLTKVLTSVRGSKGKPLRRGFNEKEKLTAHTTFGQGGKRIYYTICTYVGEVDIRCQIHYREKTKRKRWSKPKKLPPFINMKGYTATHPNIGRDPKTGREVLYFVSDRPGGKGQLDIWASLMDSLGKVTKPVNLSGINTEDNDITPFYHQNSNHLFFSSDGYQGMGGYDIYQASWGSDQWEKAEHTGVPLNSSYNDVYYFLNADSTQAYFSSNRLGAFYLEKENKVCCNDIYKVQIHPEEPSPEEPEEVDSLLVEVPPIPPELPVVDPKPEPVEEPPVPTKLEDFLPLALYFDNDEPDKRTRRKTTQKTYGATYQTYYALKPTYLKEYAAPLPELSRSSAEEEVDVFFEQKVRKGYEFLNLFADILLRRLEQGEKIEIFVKGFTSPRAQSDYNIFLGKRRISSVINHFTEYQNGIFQSYLQSGALKITEKSFGESTAAKSISDDLNDRRNSVYSPAAAQERRVEIVEIKRK